MPRDKGTDFVFTCLHCGDPFVVRGGEFNCRILRHGVMRSTMEPMNPHAPRPECERMVREGLIYGCGKPLRITRERDMSGNYIVEICDYI